ncbi:MAG: fibronectin type III domain-containing protein [Candidatus Altimarinota bacterium]
MKNKFFVFTVSLVLLSFISADFWKVLAATLPDGSEFQVNTSAFGDQEDSTVGIDSNGNFVITWTDRGGNDGGGAGVFAQRFNNAGVAQGLEFGVNTSVLGNQEGPDIAMNGNGDFVIVWSDQNGTDGNSSGVFAHLYDDTGASVTGEFLVNSTFLGDQEEARVAMDNSGNFIVAWTDRSTGSADIYAQRFDSVGDPVGSEFMVNTTDFADQTFPSVAMSSTGAFVISWTDESDADGSGNGVFAQLYDNTGATVGGEFQVNTTTAANQFNQDVAMDASGNFVVVMNESGSIAWSTPKFQRYNSAGVPQGGETLVDPESDQGTDRENMRISMESTGEFTIVWQDQGGRDGDGAGIMVRYFDADGDALSSEIPVNTSYIGDQTSPHVAITNGGIFVVTWTDTNDGDGDNNGVLAQQFFDAAPVIPGTVTTLQAEAGNTEVELIWYPPFDGGSAITDYVVEYGETVGFPGNAQVFSDGTSSITGATVTGLTNDTEYSFRIAAVNGIGTGPYSNVEEATPFAGVGSGSDDAEITVDVNDFLSFSIANLAVGDEAAGNQPFGAGVEITDLTSTGLNDYAISGSFGSPVYTQLETTTNSADGYNVVAYASNLDARTNTLLRAGGTPGNAADEISDSVSQLLASQAANESLDTGTDSGIAFRLTDASTSSIIREADEETQWGDGDAGTALWASFPLGSGAAQVIYDTLTYSASATTAYINWFVGISSSQQSGSYTGQITFTASVN